MSDRGIVIMLSVAVGLGVVALILNYPFVALGLWAGMSLARALDNRR